MQGELSDLAVETTLKSYKDVLKGAQQSSHLYISHKAESIESVLASIEAEVNSTELALVA